MSKIPELFVNDSLDLAKPSDCRHLLPGTKIKSSVNEELKIEKMELEDKHLKIQISYSGGCGPVYLKMQYDSTNMSKKKTLELIPDFTDNDDCESIRSRTVCFNLEPIISGRKNPLTIKLGKMVVQVPVRQ